MNLKTLRALFVLCAIAVSLSGNALAAPAGCKHHYLGGQRPEITHPPLSQQARELCFKGFGVVHSGVARAPLWSAERLTREAVLQAKTLQREDVFHEEDRLPLEERATLADFARSGYDRGHLAPSGDMPSQRTQGESFSLANIIAQHPTSNQTIWSEIESAVRTFARRQGEIFVITGPLFHGDSAKRLNGRVLVPSHVYKVVYDVASGRAAAYLVTNDASRGYRVVSVADLEKWAGIDFFPEMSASVKQQMLALPTPQQRAQRAGNGMGERQAELSQRAASSTNLAHQIWRAVTQ